jgi:hypothetical protein
MRKSEKGIGNAEFGKKKRRIEIPPSCGEVLEHDLGF